MTSRFALALAVIALLVAAFGVREIRGARAPVIVSVSIKTLIEEQFQDAVARNADAESASRGGVLFAQALEGVLAELSSEGAVILVSEAVLGSGVPDFTAEVRAGIAERMRSLENAEAEAPEVRP